MKFEIDGIETAIWAIVFSAGAISLSTYFSESRNKSEIQPEMQGRWREG